MLNQKTIEQIIDNTRQAMFDRQQDEIEKKQPISFDFAMRQIIAYRGWYCKKNQPKNYLRITCIIPPGTIEHPNAWIRKLESMSKQVHEFFYLLIDCSIGE